MKGDKVVEIDQDIGDLLLFGHSRNLKFILQHFVNIEYSIASSTTRRGEPKMVSEILVENYEF